MGTEPALTVLEDDSPAFVEWVNGLLQGLVRTCSAETMLITRVAGWFDSKWLGFNGKTLGAAGVRSEDPRVPPLVDGRRVSTNLWQRKNDCWVLSQDLPPNVYHKGWSWENLPQRRRFDKVLPSTTGAWVSTGSADDPHAAVMVYASHEGELTPFYIGVELDTEAQPCQLVGISAEALQNLLSPAKLPES